MNSADRAAVMAYKILLRHGDGTLPVEPMALLRRCRGVKVMEQREASQTAGVDRFLQPGHEAVTIPVPLEDGGLGRLVVYDGAAEPARLRFTLAHELGHIALRHTGGSEKEEREADLFASHLLIPRPVLRQLAEERSLYVEELCTLFFVSPTALRRTRYDRPLSPEDDALFEEVAALFAASAHLPPLPRRAQSWHHLTVKGVDPDDGPDP